MAAKMNRMILNWNENWIFEKEGERQVVNLPHTWNALDGQDGGNDYYRGTCFYEKTFQRPKAAEDARIWLEINGAAMTCTVTLNGRELMVHAGGYSIFRVDLTEFLEDTNQLVLSVDNGKNDMVYPQKADFTFYGGVYRDVNLIIVPKEHFALGYNGGSGFAVTPEIKGTSAEVLLEAWVENAKPESCVIFKVVSQEKKLLYTTTATVQDKVARAKFTMENVHLWNGIKDPYLYTAYAELANGDCVLAEFGCRNFSVDPERGFILNGEPYRLCGVARHQDRQGVGNALTKSMQEEDLALIREIGATSIRLAHYQHDQYFYDLCDRLGLVVWAEIPYITMHMPNGRKNTVSQMTELVVQNYNHASIVCWGLSNEITTAGGVTEDMVENHKILNDLCHRLDPTRLTTMAHVFMLDPDDPFVTLSDVRSYNLYYGWYVGKMEQNEEWLDNFHAAHPDTVIGLSEYGADANPAYQSGSPVQGDWSEGYQALYHEHMLSLWSERPYLWAMHCWNMFDFGADGREEGGKPGQNQKGLVTFDRKYKKDAFYIYKAYLSKEPFIHLCGKLYRNRTGEETEIKVYSNQEKICLYVDGKMSEEQTGSHVFRFRVPLTGTHEIVAKSGILTDSMTIARVDSPDLSYCKNPDAVENWFDKEEFSQPEGYYHIYVTMETLHQCPEAEAVLEPVMKRAAEAYGDVAQDVEVPESMKRMLAKMTVEENLKQMGSVASPELLREINAKLNKIKIPCRKS